MLSCGSSPHYFQASLLSSCSSEAGNAFQNDNEVATTSPFCGVAQLERCPDWLQYDCHLLGCPSRPSIYVRCYDRGLIWLNLLFLLFVAIAPLPSAIVGEYDFNQSAHLFYAGGVVAAGLAKILLCWHASHHRDSWMTQSTRMRFGGSRTWA